MTIPLRRGQRGQSAQSPENLDLARGAEWIVVVRTHGDSPCWNMNLQVTFS